MQISQTAPYQNYNYNNRNISTNNVTFTAYTSVFGKRLESVLSKKCVTDDDRTFLISWVQRFLKTKITPDNKLGEGAHGAVYRIDDRYCMKVPTGKDVFVNTMDELPSDKFDVLKTYYGGDVADFSGVKILKNVSSGGRHIQVGVPDRYRAVHISAENLTYYDRECLPRLAGIPQASFDAVVQDCAALNRLSGKNENYVFDYKNPNNFVIVGRSLRILDGIDVKRFGGRNSLADLLDAFINKIYLNHSANYSEKGKKYRREIFKKLVLAAMKTDIPIKPKMQADELMWYISTQELCRFDASNDEIINKLAKIQSIKDQKSRLEKAKKYLDKISQ